MSMPYPGNVISDMVGHVPPVAKVTVPKYSGKVILSYTWHQSHEAFQ